MPKIAIIDDDPDIVEAVSILLEANGCQILSAGNVNDGFRLIEKEQPDLVILDVMMDEPDDGFFLAIKLRKKGYSMPIFMLTSVSKALGLEFGTGESLPVNEFLEKPISPKVLLDKINSYLTPNEV
jgi:DNA-binding response OmpR family regulator